MKKHTKITTFKRTTSSTVDVSLVNKVVASVVTSVLELSFDVDESIVFELSFDVVNGTNVVYVVASLLVTLVSPE